MGKKPLINVYAQERDRKAKLQAVKEAKLYDEKIRQEAFLSSMAGISKSRIHERAKVEAINDMGKMIYEKTLETMLFKTFTDSLVMDEEYISANMEGLHLGFLVQLDEVGGLDHVVECAKGVPFLADCVEKAKAIKTQFVLEQKKALCEGEVGDSIFDFNKTFADNRDSLSKVINSTNSEQISEIIKKKVIDTIAYEKGEAIANSETLEDIENNVDGNIVNESTAPIITIRRGNRILREPNRTLFSAINESVYKRRFDEAIMESACKESTCTKENAGADKGPDLDFMTDRLDFIEDMVDDMSADEDGVDLGEDVDIDIDLDEVLAEAITEYTVIETFNTLNLTKFKSGDVRDLMLSYLG